MTQDRKEGLAIDSLQLCGINCFLPKIEKTFLRRGRHYREDAPLFAGYVFFQINDEWRNVFHKRGVIGVVMSSDRSSPSIVRPNVIRDLWLHYTPDEDRQRSDFEIGQSVKPLHGPFAKLSGIYDGTNKHNRDVVLFSLFGRQHSICYDVGELIAA